MSSPTSPTSPTERWYVFRESNPSPGVLGIFVDLTEQESKLVLDIVTAIAKTNVHYGLLREDLEAVVAKWKGDR